MWKMQSLFNPQHTTGMNYEEMLEAREGVATHREQLPLGFFYKKLIDKKYRHVISLKPSLTDSIVFCESLKRDCELTGHVQHGSQLHFAAKEDSGGIYELELEQGSYLTFAQLLDSNPAVVAQKDFIDRTIEKLADLTVRLNGEGVYTLCFAPQTVFARKSDNAPLLLIHGSFYQGMSDSVRLYEGFEQYVAPEVLAGDNADDRSDVYALGKFIERLFAQASMPIAYRRVVARATRQDPAQRYQSVSDMMATLKRLKALVRSALSFGLALAAVLLCFAVYFETVPETTEVEFVPAAEKEAFDDLLDDGFDPGTELGLVAVDSSGNQITPEDRKRMAEYEAKAEQIFRKRYAEAAEQILAKVYNSDYATRSEKDFMTLSTEMNEQLVATQMKLAADADISDSKSQRIAAEIIEMLTNRMKRDLGIRNGYQKRARPDDE